MITDKITVTVKAGNGGNGAVSFRREKYVARGGPDGGDGGNGGNIVVVEDRGANTLLAYKYRKKFAAGNGGDGSGSKFHGADGEDVTLPVPPGTVIRTADGEAVIHDMSDGEPFILCRGGRGGWGNRHFATPTRQVPQFAKPGLPGEEKEVIFELKMLADVGLIGFPNVGKSSILAQISDARPKIADYHFTTLSPNLGVVGVGEEGGGFVVADIPGLIEGASDGAGLGHEFLRHIDRCRLLVHVVDISGNEGRDPAADIATINAELEKYSPDLATRPQIIAANKFDAMPDDGEARAAFERAVAEYGYDFIYVSAATGYHIRELVSMVSERLKLLPPVITYEPDPEVIKADSSRRTDVVFTDGVWQVEGEWLRQLMDSVNFDNRESLMYFQRILRTSGVIELLESHGVTDGDTVSICGFEFDFIR